MIISIVSLVIGIISLAVSLFAIFYAKKTNKATEQLLLEIKNMVEEEESKQRQKLAIIKRLIDGKPFDDD